MKNNVLLIGGAGFVGSALLEHLNKTCNVDVVDIHWYSKGYFSREYSTLDRSYLSHYSVIILLAGYSSPEQCRLVRPDQVYEENVNKFVQLCRKINWDNQRLIYASSASVSSGIAAREEYPFQSPVNTYDWSKQLLDNVARFVAPQGYGLRLGTVNGYSPNPRRELLLNSMTLSALQNGEVRYNHGENLRSVLWMQDLCRAVQAIIEKPGAKPGPYNVSSINGSIYSFAETVSHLTGAKLIQEPDTGTFSFSLNCDKFEKEFDFEFTYDIVKIVEDCKRNREIIEANPGVSFRRNYLP
jgi:nucleoside-diphosphate-sugar epimerase